MEEKPLHYRFIPDGVDELTAYLKAHETDIHHSINDYGDLHNLFVLMIE